MPSPCSPTYLLLLIRVPVLASLECSNIININEYNVKNVPSAPPGHAYALMQAEEVEGRKFLRLRNPWGKFEWKGAWADGSPQWNQHPKV